MENYLSSYVSKLQQRLWSRRSTDKFVIFCLRLSCDWFVAVEVAELHNKLALVCKLRKKWPNHTCNKESATDVLFFEHGLGWRLGFIHLRYMEWRENHFNRHWPISSLISVVCAGRWMSGWIRHMVRYLQWTVAIVVNAAFLFTTPVTNMQEWCHCVCGSLYS